MNNKGQTLVMFVILIPIIILLFVYVIDLGSLYVDRKNIESIVDRGIEYYKEGKDVKEYINRNIDADVDIQSNNGISITIKKKVKGIFKDYNIEIYKEG